MLGRHIQDATAPNLGSTVRPFCKRGEIARLVRQNGWGIVIEPGDGNGLAEAFFCADTERVVDMGWRARALLDAHFTRRHAVHRSHAVLERTPAHIWTRVSLGHRKMPRPLSGPRRKACAVQTQDSRALERPADLEQMPIVECNLVTLKEAPDCRNRLIHRTAVYGPVCTAPCDVLSPLSAA